jgi:ComF family protein
MYLYQEPVKSLLLSFKFGGRLTSLATLGMLAKQAGVETLFTEPDFVLPVPLHIRRLRSRGFNQALLLARTCFPGWQDKIFPDLLLRLQATTPQTSLSGKARRTNLRGAFVVPNPRKIKGKNILLIDDIFTTGSTLHECAKILQQAGARHIEAFTLARAL